MVNNEPIPNHQNKKRRALGAIENNVSKKGPGRPRKVPKALVIEQENMPLLCYCQKINDGLPMIGCDNESCPIVWFHLKCAGVKTIPDNEWYCKRCAK